ncbi:18329_t:CDS:2, partial [Racocetra persica]
EILENDNDFIEYFLDNSETETEELNDSMKKALKLLELKAQKRILTNQMYQEILKIFNCENITLYSAKKFLSNMVTLTATFVNMCVDSCCIFIRPYE